MKPEDRLQLQQILASFDDNGLVALANKGLVRRAAKDLEAGGVSHEEADNAILVRGPGWTVTMPSAGPTKATDDTPATGVTRQIVTATIYLRERWISAESAKPPAAEIKQSVASPQAAEIRQALLDLSLEDLQKWAGKTLFREALQLVRAHPEVDTETHAGLTIRLTKHEIEARLLPGNWGRSAAKLLDQLLTTAPKSQQAKWVTAAVLAFQQSQGKTLALDDDATAADTTGAPRTREQVLDAIRDLLEGMAATGLAHPSRRQSEQLCTLSVSATAVHLPRLARLLRALADDVALILERHAQASTGDLFDRLCFTFALTRAIQVTGARPPLSLVGRHRTEYEPAGDLTLAGVGAFPWRTASGYEGLTVLFWDVNAQRFRTHSISRPVNSPGRFDLKQSYHTEAIWSGGGSPERLSRSQFLLRQARVNPLGRLSAAQASSVGAAELTEPAKLDFGGRAFTSWQALLEHARSTYPIGLLEKDPLERVVVLWPASWGTRVFDEMHQRLTWPLTDAEGATAVLALPWTEVNEPAIEFLEAVNPTRDRLTAVVTRIGFGEQGLALEPLALLSEGTPQGHRVLNPAFDRALIKSPHSALLDRLRKKYGRDRIATVLSADDDADDGEMAATANALPAGLQARLSDAESLLLRLAETGVRRLDELALARLKQIAAALERTGLGEVAAGFARFEDAAAAPESILWCGYLCCLCRQAATAL